MKESGPLGGGACARYAPLDLPMLSAWTPPTPVMCNQGGQGTGKTGNLVINFSRQGKHREFRYNMLLA